MSTGGREGSGGARALPDGIVRGLALWSDGRYFEAHEAMEEAWLTEPGPRRLAWQGLIQAVVACHQLERGNVNGARKMIDAALAKLEPLARGAASPRAVDVPLDLGLLVRDLRAAGRALRGDSAAGIAPVRPPPERSG